MKIATASVGSMGGNADRATSIRALRFPQEGFVGTLENKPWFSAGEDITCEIFSKLRLFQSDKHCGVYARVVPRW